MQFTMYTRSGDRSLEFCPFMFKREREFPLFHGGLPLNAGFESDIRIQSSEHKICPNLMFHWCSYFPTILESKGQRWMFKFPFTTRLEVASPAKEYRGSVEAPIYMNTSSNDQGLIVSEFTTIATL